MFNQKAVVVAKVFGNGKLDKNDKAAILLDVVAGRSVNRTVIAGTVAERDGFVVGGSYLIQTEETEPSEEYGRQFRIKNLGKIATLDILDAEVKLGAPIIVNIDQEVEDKATVDATSATIKEDLPVM